MIDSAESGFVKLCRHRRAHPIADEGARLTRDALTIARRLRQLATTTKQRKTVTQIVWRLRELEGVWKPKPDTRAKPKSTACET